MNLKNKSILVTGGAGFIGSHLVDRLIFENPEKIVVASNFFLGNIDNLSEAKGKFKNLNITRCDVSDYEEIKEIVSENNIDVIFNLAVIPLPTSLVRPEWTIKKNIDITLNVCRLQRENLFKTLIQFSSSEAYGSAKEVPMKESHLLDPETPYAASKAATDDIALSYHHTFGCDTSIIRPFNQYGPRQNARKYAALIPLTIGRMLRDEPVIIYGDGEQTRDFMYVTDTADAAVEIFNNTTSRGKILNVASEKEISVNKVVKSIAQLLNYKKPFIYKQARAGDVRRHLGSNKMIKELIEWEPKVSFENGIKMTVDWYKKNPTIF